MQEKLWCSPPNIRACSPAARDPSLWDTPCVGQGWALLGDAAGHVHPITGEGIAYALWSAELLAQALQDAEPQEYDRLRREAYGRGFSAASRVVWQAGRAAHAYESVFQWAMMASLQS